MFSAIRLWGSKQIIKSKTHPSPIPPVPTPHLSYPQSCKQLPLITGQLLCRSACPWAAPGDNSWEKAASAVPQHLSPGSEAVRLATRRSIPAPYKVKLKYKTVFLLCFIGDNWYNILVTKRNRSVYKKVSNISDPQQHMR